MRKQLNEKGITIIALTVTIIVLLILASISLTANKGIIKQSKEAKEAQEIKEEIGVLEISIVSAVKKDSFGQITQENLDKALKNNIGDGKYELGVEDDKFKVTFKDKEEERTYYIDEKGNVIKKGDESGSNPDSGTGSEPDVPSVEDKTPPTVTVTKQDSTSNSIIIKVQATDSGSGIPSNPQYTYYIKESTAIEYVKHTTNGETEHTYTGLEQNKSYDIKVEVADKDGNIGSGTITGVSTGKIPSGSETGTIMFGTPVWNAGKASVKISTDTEYNIQYKKNTNEWTQATKEVTVTDLIHEDTLYARLWDGANGGEETSVVIRDEIVPTVTIKSSSSTTNTITAEATVTDAQSGIPSTPTYTFYIKKTSEADSSYTQIQSGGSASVTKTELEDGISYTIKVTVKDVAGNTGTVTKEITTVQIADGTSGLTDGTLKASTPVWNNGTASITLSTTTNLTIQYQVNSTTGTWTSGTSVTGLKHNDVVYARLWDGVNAGKEGSVTILDSTLPTITVISSSSTSNSVTIGINATDAESGLPATPTYIFYIKKTSEADSSYTQIQSGSETMASKIDLTQNTSYTIKVTVQDIAGNIGTVTKEITTTQVAGATSGLQSGNITASSPVWSGGKASITLSTTTDLTIQYQVNSITGTWTSGTSVTGLNHNDTVYARLWDGTNAGQEASVTVLDGTNPIINSVTVQGYTSNTMTVAVDAVDNQSGIASYSYFLGTSDNDLILKSTTTEATYEYTGLTAGTTYTVKVVVTDKADKTAEVSKTLTSSTTYTWDKYSLNTTNTYYWNKYDIVTKYKWSYTSKIINRFGEYCACYVDMQYDENSNVATGQEWSVGFGAGSVDQFQRYANYGLSLPFYFIPESEELGDDQANAFYKVVGFTQVDNGIGTLVDRTSAQYWTNSSYTAQGATLQGTVTSTSSSAYPTDGVSGSNWYVYSKVTTSYSKGSTSHGQVTSTSSSSYSGTTNGKAGEYWYDYAGETINWALN